MNVNMALDDIIAKNKKNAAAANINKKRRQAAQQLRQKNQMGVRKNFGAFNGRIQKQNRTFVRFPRMTNPVFNSPGFTITLSNLHYGVSNSDILELFQEFGQILKYGVSFDKSGRSNGFAKITFLRRNSAIQALNRYNGVPLDNRPMKITLDPTNNAVSAGGVLTQRNRAFNQKQNNQGGVDILLTGSKPTPRPFIRQMRRTPGLRGRPFNSNANFAQQNFMRIQNQSNRFPTQNQNRFKKFNQVQMNRLIKNASIRAMKNRQKRVLKKPENKEVLDNQIDAYMATNN